MTTRTAFTAATATPPPRLSVRMARRLPALAALAGLLCALAVPPARAAAPAKVRLWETNQVIPTYRVAPPDLNPRFYQGRTYQGARATFYPYPVSDRLTDVRENQTYRVVRLENPYVALSILPEIGGRIFSAVDKSNGYDFFYRQRVIKPALIGMLGAWISGGVEWNVPHHHRATSFLPVDYTLQDHPDGSKTVWVGETEWRHRMKWIVGLTLHPDRSYLEMTVKMFNPTPLAHSFLFWINPAVHANTNYQVLFPPGTEYAVQHGKPEFAHWPIARETYGGVDYSRGVDISWWKNHPSPVSFFAWNFEDDFFGGYDHGRQAGVLHVANHHIAPGKKFFEWGAGPDGDRWSQVLTDEDGPYLELMAGAYSDNQPDYSWIQPGEVKTWKHYWYPLRRMGGVKNATRDAALNFEITNSVAGIALNVTVPVPGARVELRDGEKILYQKTADLAPDTAFTAVVPIPMTGKPEHLRVSLSTADGRELVAYQPVKSKNTPMPAPVKRPLPPKEIPTSEELYLTGLRIEQLYNPAFEAAPYYEEALRRDPGDYRANTALGLLWCKDWRWEEAEARLGAALARATKNYIRPKDGEAFYYLGVALRAQGRRAEAYEAFYKAIWSQAWQAAGYLALAELDCREGRHAKALELANRSLAAGELNTKAHNLKAALLRKLGRAEEAAWVAERALDIDPLDFGAANELYLAQAMLGKKRPAAQTLARLVQLMRGEAQSALELAVQYGHAGLWGEAIEVLQRVADLAADPSRLHPMVGYALGYYHGQLGGAAEALKCYQLAARMRSDYCFPFRSEEEAMLLEATAKNPQDARAPYYLGNLLYDHQPTRAIAAWEQSRQLDAGFAPVHRNLGLAYAQTRKDFTNAIASLEQAVALHPQEPRFFYELDVQYEAAGQPVQKRLDQLTRHHDVVAQRDDALTREILLLMAAGQHDRALELLTQRRFHNWEGRSEIHGLYAEALLLRGQVQLRAGQPAAALRDFEAALEYPFNLEVGRPHRDRKAPQIYCFIATAHEAMQSHEKARFFYDQALEPRESAPSEIQYYQGLALKKLGQPDEARPVFEGLIRQGQDPGKGGEPADYFAKFGEKQTERVRRAQAHYLAGLGHRGLDQAVEAQAQFKQALEWHPAHIGANAQMGGKPAR